MAAPSVIRTVSTSSAGFATVTLSTLLVDGSNTCLIVSVGIGSVGEDIDTVTHNSDALTQIGTPGYDGAWNKSVLWQRLSPDAGTFDIVVSASAGGQIAFGATLLNDTAQSSTFNTPVSGGAGDTNNSLSVTSAADELVISVICTDDETGITKDAAATELWKIETLAADTSHGAQYKVASGTPTTMAWTQDISGWGAAAVAIRGLGGSAVMTPSYKNFPKFRLKR